MPQSCKVFRVFICSTFTDFHRERDALQTNVFPAFQARCTQNGFRLQPIDLRWGITAEASHDHRAVDICLAELRRCLDAGLHPAVLLLLGQRYGWRPLPAWIAASDFDRLSRHFARHNSAVAKLLAKWYRRDDNAVPSVYWLRRIRRGDKDWRQTVEAPLRRALISGVRKAGLPQTLLDNWERSLTEQEARMAMAFHRKQPCAFAYLRTIDSVELLPPDFCDREDDDYEAVTDLRIKLWSEVQSQLPDHHRHLKAELVKGEVSDRYLAEFCETVLQDLTQAAATEFSRPNLATPSELEREAHRSSMAWSGKPEPRLAEREIELTLLLKYLQSPSRYPLIIVGESGSGKSTFLLHAAGQVRQQHPHWRIIQRFIGRTPDSTDQRRLLRGLCEEMDEHYHNEDPVPESFTQLADGLRRRLMRIPPERPLLLLLDGLDQVQRADVELLLSFIPSVIPTSVRLVVSVVEDCSPLQPLLQKYFSLRGQDIREPVHHLRARYPAEAFLTLGGLTPLAAESLAEAWLGDRPAPRRLQPAQLSVLMNGFRACSLPLYLRIATEEAAQLRSGDEACFPESLTVLCQQLFDRLSKPQNHSPRLVQRVLGYLLSATHGLAEDELLELLARDADFMAGFRRRSERLGQPLQENLTSVPSAVWARLYHDLAPFLVTRNVGGIHLMDLFHQGMENSVAQWVNSATRARCQVNLINYFRQQNTWADSVAIQREKVLSIPPQTRTANLRKILELPTLLMRHAPSRKKLKESLLDPDFLEALCESGRVDQLVEALRVSSRFHGQKDISKPDEVELSLFRLAVVIMAHRDFLERHPTSLFQTLYNYFHFSVDWEEINDFLNRWKIHRQTNTPGFPWIRYRSTPPLQDIDTSLTLSFRHDAPIEALAVSPTGGYIACGDSRGALRVYRVMDWNARWTTQYRERLAFLIYGPDGSKLYAACWDGDSVRELDSLSGTEERVFEGLQGVPLSLAISRNGELLAAGCSDHHVYIWDLRQGRLLHRMAGHADAVMAVCFAQENTFLASGGRDHRLFLWSCATGVPVVQPEVSAGAVEALCCLSDGCHIASAHADGTVAVWKVPVLDRIVIKQVSKRPLSCIASTSHSNGKLLHPGTFLQRDVWVKWLPILLASDQGVKMDGLSDWILVGCDDSNFYLWTPWSSDIECFAGHTSHVVSVGWDGSSPILCPVTGSHDQTIRVWGYPKEIDNAAHGLGGRHSRVSAAQAQLLGVHFAWCVPDEGVYISNFTNPLKVERLLSDFRPLCCDFNRTASAEPVLAVGTEDGTLILISPDGPARRFSFGWQIVNVRFSMGGQFLGVLTGDNVVARIEILSFPACTVAARCLTSPGQGNWLGAFAISTDGRRIAVARADAKVALYEVEDGGEEIVLLREFDSEGENILELEFDLTGRFLVGNSSTVCAITFTWNVDSGEIISRVVGYICTRSITRELMGLYTPRARDLGTEVAIEVAVGLDQMEYRAVSWLPSSVGWIIPDFSGTSWIGFEGWHACLLAFEGSDDHYRVKTRQPSSRRRSPDYKHQKSTGFVGSRPRRRRA